LNYPSRLLVTAKDSALNEWYCCSMHYPLPFTLVNGQIRMVENIE